MNDVRYAFRSLSRSKGFVAVAVISLALALGLNTTTYAVLDAFTHPVVPFREPNQLVQVGISGAISDPRRQQRMPDAQSLAIEWASRISFIKDHVTFASGFGVWSVGRCVVAAGSVREQAFTSRVSPEFFSLLGVTPERGRTFSQDDDDNTVVISHSLWTRLLARRKALADLRITLDGRAVSVIGVMPPEMTYPELVDIWQLSATGIGPQWYPNLAARLKPGATFKQAMIQMEALARELTVQGKPYGFTASAWVRPLIPNRYQLRQFHWALAACAFVVLLIACANLANLMLARGVARRGELALRLAIGASRRALIQQLVTEAGILAFAGGVLGIVLAAWGVSVARDGLPQMEFLPLQPMHLSWRMFLFGFLATGLAVILTGFLPALRASDVDVAEPLKEHAGTTTGRRRQRYSALVVCQVGLALVLLMGASVLAKSAYRYANQDLGYEFDPHGLFNVYLNLGQQDLSDATVAVRYQSLRERTRAIPGVRAVTTWSSYPPAGLTVTSDDERDDTLPPAIRLLSYTEVTSEYLRAFSIPISEGRDFEPGDRNVAIVNEGAAVRLWRHQSPVGRMVKLGSARSKGSWLRVIGVAANRTDWNGDPDFAPAPKVFVMPARDTARMRVATVRTDGTRARIDVDLAREIQATLALPSPPRVYPVLGYHEDKSRAQYLTSNIFVFLGLCGLGLASVGLYGVLAYTVSRRSREFGVRMALGATDSDVFKLVLHDGTVMFLAGTAAGAFVAMAAASFINPLLYEVEYTDVWSLAVSKLVLCSAAFLACLAPARKATKTDPVEILRAT